MPVWVRPPDYVVPPPNNIIFNNIHNTTVINNVINRPAQAPGAGGPAALPGAKGQRQGSRDDAGRGGAALPPPVAQQAH